MADTPKSESGFQYSLSNLKPAEPVNKIALTFPDGARRDFPRGTTGLDIAKGISPSLAKRTVAMALDGTLADLNDPIEADAKIELIGREDPRALELIRHDAAHVLAEAVQSLWPGTQVTIGPVIENGFYYDFFRNEPFTPEDFAAIEKRMREIIARDKPFTKEVWDREKTKQVFRDKGEAFKVELVDGSYHDVDSSEMAFKIAGSMAYKEAARKAQPVLLEPLMAVEVRTPEEYMGDVIGDLNSRRGQIQSMEDATGVKVVKALVPLSEMFGYIGDLRSKTQGRAVYSMTFHSYAEVPKAVADEIVQKSQGE